jgi:hypothetical protein
MDSISAVLTLPTHEDKGDCAFDRECRLDDNAKRRTNTVHSCNRLNS